MQFLYSHLYYHRFLKDIRKCDTLRKIKSVYYYKNFVLFSFACFLNPSLIESLGDLERILGGFK